MEKEEKYIVVDEATIKVNLHRKPSTFFYLSFGHDPNDLVFDWWRPKKQWVEVKRNGHLLYVDNRVVSFVTVPKGLRRDEVEKILDRRKQLCPNILDTLLENQHLIPDVWRKEPAIYFVGTIFKKEIPGSRWPLPKAYWNNYRCMFFRDCELYNPRKVWDKSYREHAGRMEREMTVACL